MEWFGLRFVEGFKDEQGAHPVRRLSCASSRGALWGKIQLGSGGALGHLWHYGSCGIWGRQPAVIRYPASTLGS